MVRHPVADTCGTERTFLSIGFQLIVNVRSMDSRTLSGEESV
jgi:hypothetical protein